MSPLPEIVLIIAMGLGAWWWFQSRYAFVVRIVAGEPICQKGKVTQAFLNDVRQVCRWSGVASGSIYGMLMEIPCKRGCRLQRKTRIKLSFSSTFPRDCQQQLRNLSLVQQ